MQNNIKVWIESSTLSFDLNSHDEGVYLISDLDGLTSLPSIRTSAGVNAGTDGGWTSAQAFDARLISLSVVIANEDVSIVESKRRLLNSLLAQSRKETLKLHFTTEAGMEFIINVRITAVTGALTNILKKQELLIQMRADDPIIYGAQGGEGADATLLVQQTQSGFEIPFEIPLLIGGGSDKVDVEDLGTEEVYPIIKMTGPLHNPTVVNETQNAEIGINADLGDMEWRGYQSAELLGNTTQQTYSGKNKANIYAIPNQTGANLKITVANETITIADNANIIGYTNTTKKLSEVCPTLQVGDTVYLFFDTTSSSTQKNNIYIQGTGANIYWEKGTSKTITQAMLDSIVILYGGHDETAVISNFMITATNDSTYEKYVGGIPSPNPDYPQNVNTVSGRQEVQIVGKNLTHNTLITQATTYAGNVVVSPNDDGTISLNGTATSNVWVNIDNIVLPAGANIAHIGNTTQSTTTGGYTFSVRVENGDINFAYNSSNHYVSVYLWSGQTYDNAKVYVQIEKGDEATEWQEYQGQSYELNLGKNLAEVVPRTSPAQGITATYDSTTGNITLSGTATTVYSTPFQTIDVNIPAGTYVLKQFGTLSHGRIGINLRRADNTQITEQLVNTSNLQITFTLTEDAQKMHLLTGGHQANESVEGTIQVMLVAGSTAGNFAPYKTPMELCKIGTYQDYIYKSGEKWYKHAEINKIVLDGTENWGTIWGNTAGLWTSNVAIGSEVVQGNDVGFSDHFMYKWSENSNTPCFYVYNQSGQGRIMVIQSFTSDLNTYKTWLGTNLPSVYYILATPTDTEITDSELVGQLEALLNYAPWYGDDQNVFLIPSAGAQGELILGAHNEPKPADEVLIDTHLKTVTLNGQNAYPLLKDGSSFFSLAPGDNIMYLTSDVSSDTGKAEIKFKQGFISI